MMEIINDYDIKYRNIQWINIIKYWNKIGKYK